ncbi:Bug family tripartite tricarboxylate transporter substrate binding protein [Mesobacillus campisalis]|uniref:Bug family tripartite tricarboxylate transporter substrate binding protein n=1 Tax=Mesobacillus campisalis TaxID=1408103 RepID=UPI00069A391B|nr:tripartite tricarboxylate transporter substrate binding protein [Mesobacillus campisalis]
MLKFNKIGLSIGLACTLAFSLAGCGGNQTAGTGTKEKEASAESGYSLGKNVEFVVPYSAGGGSDTNARTIAKIIKEEGLIKENILVVNKEGGSGAVGNTYTHSKKGSPSTISTFVSGQISSAVMSNAKIQLEDLTPLGTLALESFVLLVDGDSEYKTFEDFVKAAKDNPGKISVGGTGLGGEDHMVYHLTNREASIETKFVTFQGGGETLSALMGGHIDAFFSNPSEVMAQIEAGELRALATASPDKLGEPLNEIPTFKELGYDIEFQQFRGIAGPPDMPEEAVAYWENVFKGVSESEEWQNNYIEKFSLEPTYMNAEESKAFFEKSETLYKELLTELDLIK